MNERPSDIIWEKRGQSYSLLLNIICSKNRYMIVLRASPIENTIEEYILGIYLKEHEGRIFGNLKYKFDIRKLNIYYSGMYHVVNSYCSSTGNSERELKIVLDKILKYLSSSSIDKKLSMDLKREGGEKTNDKRPLITSYYL